MLVYDPNQVFPKNYSNDGGQLVMRGKQHHGTWQDFLEHREREGLHAGEVTAYDAAEGRYAYLRVDLHRAYGPKVARYDRHFAYLPSADVLLVYDRLESDRLETRWLLHLQDESAIDGAAVRTHNGAMRVEPLLPLERKVLSTGGPGYEFFSPFTKRNYPVSNPALTAEVREPGRWRVDIMPEQPSEVTEFLNAIRIGDAPQPPARLVQIEQDKGTGAMVASHVVLFGAALPLRYKIESTTPAAHLIAGLPAGQAVDVRANGSRIARLVVNAQGVLTFSDRFPGRRTITITK